MDWASIPKEAYGLAGVVLGGAICLVTTLLYQWRQQRLERKKLVEGRWVEKAGERRRRYYKLTAAGRKALAEQRRSWRVFVRALDRLTGFANA